MAEHESPLHHEPIASAPQKSALLIVFLVVFIDLFGFGIVLPLLPRYGRDFMPGGEGNRWTGAVLGLLMASFSAMQFIFAPIWGRLSDRVGRRPILLLGLVSSVVFYTLFGIASTLGSEGWREIGIVLLFVSRIGAGIAGATISTAQAVIADSTTPQNRARGMALIGAAFGIGFCFGPLLGFAVLLIPDFPAGPGYLAAALSAIAGVIGFFKLPETLKPGVSHGRRKWFDRHGLQLALQVPGVGVSIVIFFLSTCAFANFEPTLALLTKVRAIGLSDKSNFLIFAYVGLVLALVQGILYRRLALRVSELTFIMTGTLLMALGLAGLGGVAWLASQFAPKFGEDLATIGAMLSGTPHMGIAGAPWAGLSLAAPQTSVLLIVLLMLILIVAITGFAFVVPSVQALISRLSDPTKQGEILGINQSANALARILGPFFGVVLFYSTADHTMPYVFGTLLLTVVLLLTNRLRHNPDLQQRLQAEKVHDAPGTAPAH